MCSNIREDTFLKIALEPSANLSLSELLKEHRWPR